MMMPWSIFRASLVGAGLNRGLEAALEPFEPDDVGVGDHLDLVVGRDLGDELPEIGLNVGALDGVVKFARIAAEFGFLFEQAHLESLASEPEGGVHSCHTAADHEGALVDRHHFLMQGSQVRRPGHRHPHEVLRFFSCGLRVFGVDPGILVADVGHFKQVLVQSAGLQSFHEHRFVGFGAAGGDHHPVELVFLDFFFDFLLGVLAAGEEVFIREGHVGQAFGVGLDARNIDDSADVDAAVADEHADARVLTGDIPFSGHLDSGDVQATGFGQVGTGDTGGGAGFSD